MRQNNNHNQYHKRILEVLSKVQSWGFIGLQVIKIFNKILVSEDDTKHLSMVCTLPSLTYHKEQAVYVTKSELHSLMFKTYLDAL